MKLKKIISMFTILAIVVLNVSFAYAAEESNTKPVEHEHATESSANVSEETDKADNANPKMETNFYMYLPPDPTFEDIPQMGDNGLNTTALLISTLITGIAFVGVASREYEQKKECTTNGFQA